MKKRNQTINRSIKGLAVVLAFIALGLTGTVFAAFFGAIYTTLGNGMTVNQNIYSNKADVYLNGGPQNTSANGLPNGTYYYQVTSPNGILLSEDNAICRQLVVIGGYIMGDAGDPSCNHANGTANPVTGAIPVQLIPFADTPNAGGEYKVWLIRQASNTTIDPTDPKVLHFNNSNAKTDNFKVHITAGTPTPTPTPGTTFTLSGVKFYDANADSINNDNLTVEGVRIEVSIWGPGVDPTTNPATITVVTTGMDGTWSLTNIEPGSSYSVREILPGECEGDDSEWVQTAPVEDSNGFQGYTGVANSNVSDLDFGDLCTRPGTGGHTLGFWSNKNGKRYMTNALPNGVDVTAYPATPSMDPNFMEGDLLFLRTLNLRGDAITKRQATTSVFDPTTYDSFRTWILSANAYNMSYMLSAQLAANSLNVRHKLLTDGTIVDAREICNSVGSCLGFITIGEVRELADTSLGSAGGGTTISGDPLRESQELMKDFLDDVNNNRLRFVDEEPCAVCYPAPPRMIIKGSTAE